MANDRHFSNVLVDTQRGFQNFCVGWPYCDEPRDNEQAQVELSVRDVAERPNMTDAAIVRISALTLSGPSGSGTS